MPFIQLKACGGEEGNDTERMNIEHIFTHSSKLNQHIIIEVWVYYIVMNDIS